METEAERLLKTAMKRIGNYCPVCGYKLDFEPWKGDSASHEICPSCGIEFGYHDWAEGDPKARPAIYAEWRKQWIAEGMRWGGKHSDTIMKYGEKPPENWNPIEQLKKAGLLKSD